MPDGDNIDDQLRVVNLVYHSIVADADAPEFFFAY
jgi:hypothetical protein